MFQQPLYQATDTFKSTAQPLTSEEVKSWLRPLKTPNNTLLGNDEILMLPRDLMPSELVKLNNTLLGNVEVTNITNLYQAMYVKG